MVSKNYRNSSALTDLQKNSGVLSEELVLGNLRLSLWQQESPISVPLSSGEEDRSDFPARNERCAPAVRQRQSDQSQQGPLCECNQRRTGGPGSGRLRLLCDHTMPRIEHLSIMASFSQAASHSQTLSHGFTLFWPGSSARFMMFSPQERVLKWLENTCSDWWSLSGTHCVILWGKVHPSGS